MRRFHSLLGSLYDEDAYPTALPVSAEPPKPAAPAVESTLVGRRFCDACALVVDTDHRCAPVVAPEPVPFAVDDNAGMRGISTRALIAEVLRRVADRIAKR